MNRNVWTKYEYKIRTNLIGKFERERRQIIFIIHELRITKDVNVAGDSIDRCP